MGVCIYMYICIIYIYVMCVYECVYMCAISIYTYIYNNTHIYMLIFCSLTLLA